MATSIITGQRTYSLTRDEEGHREYTIVHLIQAERGDGPGQALNTPGLPVPGNYWIVDNDIDLWAWCRADAKVSIHDEKEGDPVTVFRVEQRFSTKPPGKDKQRCQDQPIEDPLLEPPKISGSGVKYTEEATHDRFGKPINSSSHEQMRGQQVEFDNNRPSVRIEMNVPVLNLALLASMVDKVNESGMWGLPRRCVKLSGYNWDRKFHGLCSVYYTWVLDFEINYNTFDRDLLDEGTKVLKGHWDDDTGNWVLDAIDNDGTQPNPLNPQHFDRFKDRNGENAKVVLNGAGLPAGAPVLSGTTSACEILNANGTVYQKYDLTITGVASEGELDTCDECNSVNGTYTLTHVEGCIWESAGVSSNCEWAADPANTLKWRMEKNALDDIQISIVGQEQMIWYVPATAFDPDGTTSLSRVDNDELLPIQCSIWPLTVSLTVHQESTSVGSIHVEKYSEANFLLLGVPLSF